MNSFYITFGGESPFANYLLEVQAMDESHARRYAAQFVPKWCQVLNEEEADHYAAQWGVQVIKANPMVTCK